MKPSLSERLAPPVCDNVHDWMTMWCFIFTGALLLAWITSIFLLPEYSVLLIQTMSIIGSFTLGRVSIMIIPHKKVN